MLSQYKRKNIGRRTFRDLRKARLIDKKGNPTIIGKKFFRLMEAKIKEHQREQADVA